MGYIRSIRIDYLIKKSDHTCEHKNSFIPSENILSNFKKFSQMMGVKGSEEATRNLSKSDVKFGAQMFVALNSCPSFHVRLYWKAIYGNKTRIAMLASNIIKKVNEDFKSKALQIFTKISQVLGFQQISYHSNGNETLDTNATDNLLLQTVSNHPVHILNNNGDFSPSSFIPFCSWGDEFIGAKVHKFDIPVCNIFKPKVYYDQLCYETDLQELKSNNSKLVMEQLEEGLTLVLDYNEERQIYNNINSNDTEKSPHHHRNSFAIYLDIVSMKFLKGFWLRQEPKKC